MKRAISIVACVMALTGCVMPPPPQSQAPKVKQVIQRPAFSVEEYNSLPKKGTGKVKGEIFGVTRGGDVKIGAGVTMTLIPYTSYMKNIPDYDYNTQELSPIDPRALVGRFETKSDAQGKFEFDNVPPGEYQINGFMSWNAGYIPQIVTIMKVITVKNGEVTSVQPE